MHRFPYPLLVPSLLALAALGGAAEIVPGAPEPVEKEEPLAKRLLDNDYGRFPPLALQAMAKLMAGTVDNDAVQRFATHLQAGAWPAVRATLDTLTPEEAGHVYDHILEQLVKNDGALLPGEVIELAEIAPGDLNDARLTMLGNILKNSITLVSATGSLVARLEAGTAQFGGRDPAHRGRAAALLLAADRVIEAGAFLPPLDAALAAHDDLTLDLHARFLAAIGREQKKPAQLLKAWNLSTTILQRADPQPALAEARTRAVARCLALIRVIPQATGDAWLRGVFTTRPELGQAVLAEAATQVNTALDSKDEDRRRDALAVQYRVVSVLLASAGPQTERWRTSLDLLSLGWMNEASLALLGDEEADAEGDSGLERYVREQMKNYPTIQPNQVKQYRQYFINQYRESHGHGRQRQRNNNEAQPLAVADLLASAPTPAWLALLDSSLAQRLRSLEGEFVCRGEDRDQALTLISALAKDEPERAARLARSLVRGFTRSLEPREDEDNNRNRSANAQGIPLTRARQTRNLARLASLLTRISELPVKPVPPADLVQAFVACHSPAEVFRPEDITSVLGDPQRLPAGVLVELVSAMRDRLADAWRKPNVQQQAGTQRSDAEVVAEVERGYRVAKDLCSQSLLHYPLAWQLIMVKAALNFDHGEFVYGQQAPLATYTALRDAAFAGYADAAQAYGLSLLGEQKPDVTVYARWFAAALGASDLSYLSRQQEADGDQVTAVRDALASLPQPLDDLHRELFARRVVDSLGEISPELKARYLRHALRIIGDSPLAVEVKAIVADYDELLGEVQLDLAVDGATTVGHDLPFGARLSLRHTIALGRESGGFAKYLQNQVQGSGGAQVNYRNDLEKHLRETLGEHFSIESITFHAPDVTAHGYGRDGWRELPVAYLVLKAKDAAVDRLPSVRLDLDFVDGHGAVILPVASGVTLIDARTTPVTQAADMTSIDFTLDDRELSAGNLTLDIRAAGKGLIGGLETLLDTAVSGFTVASIDDRGPTVTALDIDGARVRPLSEHLWQVHYTPGSGAIPSSFAFPTLRTAGVTVKHQRYHDADLLDAAAVESLSPRQPWAVRLRPWLAACGFMLILALIIWLARRARRLRPDAKPRHVLPERLTPFSALAVLRAVHDDAGSGHDPVRRARLATIIADLEQRSFARDGQVVPDSELSSLTREWLAPVSA